MTNLVFSGVSGMDLPYNVWGCDIYGNNCILIATIETSIPPTLTIPLPPLFDTYPGLLIKLTNCSNCDYTEYSVCDIFGTTKQFQDGDLFFFMDGIPYTFQN
jgi:hypothetical protein